MPQAHTDMRYLGCGACAKGLLSHLQWPRSLAPSWPDRPPHSANSPNHHRDPTARASGSTHPPLGRPTAGLVCRPTQHAHATLLAKFESPSKSSRTGTAPSPDLSGPPHGKGSLGGPAHNPPKRPETPHPTFAGTQSRRLVADVARHTSAVATVPMPRPNPPDEPQQRGQRPVQVEDHGLAIWLMPTAPLGGQFQPTETVRQTASPKKHCAFDFPEL